MPHRKYQPVRPLPGPGGGLADRTWPDRTIDAAPRWCSVDLRDGNQALANPMDTRRKLALYETLVSLGISEIEVGFPAASATDAAFVRELIESGRLEADGVRIGVLTQCRQDLIDATFAAVAGAPAVTVHFYNSTSALQRRVTFATDVAGVRAIAVAGAQWCRDAEARHGAANVTYEYSPESFTDTEPDVAIEIVAATHDALELEAGRLLIVNLPATVETYTPNLYADVVEYMGRNLPRRDEMVLSIHPHNDRGTAVAAAEQALMAGAERVEGTLFGNGERTGNVDLITLAGNLLTTGVDPRLDLSRLDEVRDVAEWATGLPVGARHPYAGELVHTAFSGSHQDAIAKGMAALGATYDTWEVPYLPVDPADLGRSYEAIIRVNSQSGKGGAAYVLADRAGYQLPRGFAAEFAELVQAEVEATGSEIDGPDLVELFEDAYVHARPGELVAGEYHLDGAGDTTALRIEVGGPSGPRELEGHGNGPLDAYVDALRGAGWHTDLEILEFTTHSLGHSSDATAVCYVQVRVGVARSWGVGVHANTTTAAFAAVNSACRSISRR